MVIQLDFNPIFLYCRKHICPECGERMWPIWAPTHSDTHDHSIDDETLRDMGLDRGDLFSKNAEDFMLYKMDLQCTYCGKKLSTAQMKAILAKKRRTALNGIASQSGLSSKLKEIRGIISRRGRK